METTVWNCFVLGFFFGFLNNMIIQSKCAHWAAYLKLHYLLENTIFCCYMFPILLVAHNQIQQLIIDPSAWTAVRALTLIPIIESSWFCNVLVIHTSTQTWINLLLDACLKVCIYRLRESLKVETDAVELFFSITNRSLKSNKQNTCNICTTLFSCSSPHLPAILAMSE